MAPPGLEKVNDRLYIEYLQEGSEPLEWVKDSERLWMTLHDITLSAGASISDDDQQPHFGRSIFAIGDFESTQRIVVWQADAGTRWFSSAEIALNTDLQALGETARELEPGVLMHMVEGHKRKEPHLRFEFHLPKAIMEQLWTEAAHSLVARAVLSLKFEAFRTEVDRSFSKPWKDHRYCYIENKSVNKASFDSLWFEQSVILPISAGDE
jgi:hypothetical protein